MQVKLGLNNFSTNYESYKYIITCRFNFSGQNKCSRNAHNLKGHNSFNRSHPEQHTRTNSNKQMLRSYHRIDKWVNTIL